MKILSAFIYILLFSVSNGISKAPVLSEKAQISVITCAPGDLLYESFGHSAIRVHDPKRRLDIVFNYGIFDFNQPNFNANFVKGNLQYRLGVSPYDRFLASYIPYNRSVYEQVLELDSIDRQALFNFLDWNYLPENRYYRYDYFRNNCSSKILDCISEESANELVYEWEPQGAKTYRDLVSDFAGENQWGRFGIDLCMGPSIDRELSPLEYTFLPIYLMKFLDQTNYKNGRPLVKERRLVYQGEPRKDHFQLWDPLPLGWLFFVLFSFAYLWLRPRYHILLDIPLISMSILAGLLLAFLWFFTDHVDTYHNYNLLWLTPLNILLLIPIRRIKKSYSLVYGVLLIVFVLSSPFLPQAFNPAIYPILLLLLVRTALIYRYSTHPSGAHPNTL